MNPIQPTQKKVESSIPFVLSLSNNNVKHVPILDLYRSIKMKSALVTLKPGESVGSHNTGMYEELLVVLEGNGEVEAEGLGKQRISKEYVAFIPASNQHNVHNVGTTPLRYVYIVSKIE